MNLREIWLSGSQFPVTLWLVCLIAIALVVRWLYSKAYRSEPARHLWWLRFAAIGLTLIALADLTSKEFHVELPQLIVAIDDSESFGLPHDLANPSVNRLDATKSILTQQRLEQLAKRYRLSFWRIGNGASKLDSENPWQQLQSKQTVSHIGDDAQEIIDRQAGQNAAAMLLFSDGATTSGQSLSTAGTKANQQSIPIFVVGMGSRQSPPNVKLTNLRANNRIRVDEPLRLTLDLEAESVPGQSISIVVKDEETGNELSSQQIEVNGNQFRRTVSMNVVSRQAGPRKILIEASVVSDENNTNDNHLAKLIQVVAGRTKVLIVQDMPDPWFRFLKKTLVRASDPQTGANAFEVRTLLQQASREFQKTDETALNGFPSPTHLAEFDVVVFGDVRLDSQGQSRGLTENNLRALRQYVAQESGNVVFVPGPLHHTELVNNEEALALLPFSKDEGFPKKFNLVETERFELRLDSEADAFSPTRWLRQNMSRQSKLRFNAFSIFEPPSPTIVLAKFPAPPDQHSLPMPAITMQKIAGGTVVTHLTNELFKLRYRSSANLFENYWVRLVTDLAAERLQNRDASALLNTNATEYSIGDSVEVVADIFDPTHDTRSTNSISVLLTNQNGRSQEVNLIQENEGSSRYRTRLNQLPVGQYELAWSNAAQVSETVATDFRVSDGVDELSVLNQQSEQLSRLANNSGGLYFDGSQAEPVWSRLFSRLPKGGWNQLGGAKFQPIWSWPLVPVCFAVLVIGLLVIEWFLRRTLRLE